MATFQERFPEHQASHGPLMGGQQVVTNSDLHKFRLYQLRHLARAFGVRMDMDAPKQEILPILEAAERQGVFRGRPTNIIEYQKAFWHADDGPCPHGLENETALAEAPRAERSVSEIGWNELRSICREWYPDAKIYGRSRDDVECLYLNGAFPEDLKGKNDVDSTDDA